MAGDRLAWIGEARAGMESASGVLTIVDFRECALVIGDTDVPDHVLSFGALSTPDSPKAIARARHADDFIE